MTIVTFLVLVFSYKFGNQETFIFIIARVTFVIFQKSK